MVKKIYIIASSLAVVGLAAYYKLCVQKIRVRRNVSWTNPRCIFEFLKGNNNECTVLEFFNQYDEKLHQDVLKDFIKECLDTNDVKLMKKFIKCIQGSSSSDELHRVSRPIQSLLWYNIFNGLYEI